MVTTDEICDILNGAFQVAGSPTDSCEVKMHNTSGELPWADDVPTSGYAGAWNGLAWSYSLAADLGHNSSGQVVGHLGSPIASPTNILQNFWEEIVSGPLDSAPAEVQ